jgi:hypothetical protein
MTDDRTVAPLSFRKPWWVVVVAVMVAFGYLQEDVKIKLNHYMAVGERYSDFYTYKYEVCEWDAQCMYDARKDWWDRLAPQVKGNYYVSRDTYDIFHRWGEAEMLRAKWGLMATILLCFFMLDALFLMAAGVGDRWRLLFMVYAVSGLVVFVFWALDGGEGAEDPGYNVAREVLGFLQSPLPSLSLVLLPWLRERALRNAEGGQGG